MARASETARPDRSEEYTLGATQRAREREFPPETSEQVHYNGHPPMEEPMLQALEGKRERGVTTPRPALAVARLPRSLPRIAAR